MTAVIDGLVARSRWLVVALALASGGASVLVHELAFGGQVHSLDEMGYLFAARSHARGLPAAPAPPAELAGAFHMPFLVRSGVHWHSRYPPAWPLVLVPGVWLGYPVLVTLSFNVLSVLLMHAVLIRLVPAAPALAGTALLATSPFFVVLGAMLMTQSLALSVVIGS